MEQKEIKKVYRKFRNSINMTFNELLLWNRNPISKTASLNRQPIRRVLRLLSKKNDLWNTKDIEDANKVISFIARAKGIEKEYKKNNPKDKSLTKNRIALRNWGFDVYKKKNKT